MKRKAWDEKGGDLGSNPPRLITTLVALVLLILGISATIFPIEFINSWFSAHLFTPTMSIGYFFLAASSGLMLLGSYFRGL